MPELIIIPQAGGRIGTGEVISAARAQIEAMTPEERDAFDAQCWAFVDEVDPTGKLRALIEEGPPPEIVARLENG